jgi:hypothetical protein
MPVASRQMWLAIACVMGGLGAGEARAEGPCSDGTRHRIVKSAKGGKPIAITAAGERPVYGELVFVELNGDGKQDVVLASACIRSPADSVRLHRVYASCGPAAGGGEEYAIVFEEEELCARAVKIEAQAAQTTVKGVAWRDLQLMRTLPGKRCEQATQVLQFDGAQYRAGPRTTAPCPKP